MSTLQNNPNITLIFKTSYAGMDYTFTIPASAVRPNPLITWYGPLYLLINYGQYAFAAPTGSNIPPVPVLQTATKQTANAGTHTIVRGDSLFKIAKQYNTTVNKLIELNKLKNSNLIYPGQVIKVN